MKLIKHIIGIDIAKEKFDFCLGSRDESFATQFSAAKTLMNSSKGFEALLKQIKALNPIETIVVMEATGNYYERLAYFLSDHQIKLSVIHANHIYNYNKSFGQKSKTDAIDAKKITQYGLERELKHWKKPELMMRQLKTKTREHQSLTEAASHLKIEMKSHLNGVETDENQLKRFKKRLELLEKQIESVFQEMNELIELDQAFKQKIMAVEKIQGIGRLTLLKVIAETECFEQFKNMKQVASYAGLDVQQNESGQHKGKGRLSKKGNTHLRNAMYMPAVSAIRFNPSMRTFYQRLVSKGKLGKQAVVAVARKLLLLIFTLWKTGRQYDPTYHKNISTANI